MMGPVLVTGGTGTLGRHVVRRLVDTGNEVRVLSRRPRPEAGAAGAAAKVQPGVTWHTGDLATGAGLDPALAGAATVIHCASDPRHASADIDGTHRLMESAGRVGVGHLVYISIVGIDRIPLGYYRTKLATENAIMATGQRGPGWTILRTTQFHDLVLTFVEKLTRPPLVVVPAGISFQPVDVDEVAQRLVTLAGQDPGGRAPDMGGPEVRSMGDLARTYLKMRGKRRPVAPVWLPGAIARTLRGGANLTAEHADGRRTWEEFLRAQP